MRFMMFVRADKKTEAGVLPSKELLAAMGRFNEEMAKAGVLLAGEGIQPSAKGARVTFGRGTPGVTNGPFPANELVAGFWMIQTASKDEAIGWAKRVPFNDGEVVEIRQVFEASDSRPRSCTHPIRRASRRCARSYEARRGHERVGIVRRAPRAHARRHGRLCRSR
jgi:hypothetical protein